QNDVTLKMPAFEWVHVQLHQQKGMISLSPPTICNSAESRKSSASPLPSYITGADKDAEAISLTFASFIQAFSRQAHSPVVAALRTVPFFS
ncbi:hypothetical protein AB0U48_25515, partial [Escherichia coli]